MVDTNEPDVKEAVFKTADVYIVTGRSVLAFDHPNESV
jgi:hypothetical protein